MSTVLALSMMGVGGLAIGGSACDVAGPDKQPGGPAPHLLSVSVRSTSDTKDLSRKTLASDGSTVVPAFTSFELKFDRYMLPSDANRQSVCLNSSKGAVKTFNDCENRLFLHPSYDPVTRTVTYFQDGTKLLLVAGETYRLTVFNDDNGEGYRAFDGVALDQRYEFTFTVDKTVIPDTTAPEGPEETKYCSTAKCKSDGSCPSPQTFFLKYCVTCHGDNPSKDPALKDDTTIKINAPMGLYLNDRGLQRTAIGVTAHQTELGGGAQTPAKTPERFGVAMAIIQPGDPGDSYLIYKMLATPDLVTDKDLADGETDRIANIVTGLSMPGYRAGLDHPIIESDVAMVSKWITSGAPVSSCGVAP